MAILKAGLVQFDVKMGNLQANMDHMENSLAELSSRETELVLLPEMWSCGFDYPNLSDHARETPHILERLCRFARQSRMIIAGSLPEWSSDGVYNTHYVVNSQGQVQAGYRKVHRFLPAGEEAFLPGQRSVLVDTPWGKAGLLTCYDLRFPEQSRALVLEGAVMLLVSAQWPEVRISHWDVLARARAVENQVFVVACNRCGKDPDLVYGGQSLIVSPWGEILTNPGQGEAVTTAEMDFDQVQDFRKRIPCQEHRSPEAYDLKNIDSR